jgi:hypothetical protein
MLSLENDGILAVSPADEECMSVFHPVGRSNLLNDGIIVKQFPIQPQTDIVLLLDL